MSGIRFAPSPTQRTRLVSRDSVPVLSPGSDHARKLKKYLREWQSRRRTATYPSNNINLRYSETPTESGCDSAPLPRRTENREELCTSP
ncbi:hypothetical protein K449DRAFT_437099 [Hypoxylon sp. EC38]|nr:hypothetical protein K449DRAFT_437099 [Hypoxylon sp. EC38]